MAIITGFSGMSTYILFNMFYFRNNREGAGDKVGHLVMILAGVSAIVIVLVMVLTYLVFGRKGGIVSNKFTVLDDQGNIKN